MSIQENESSSQFRGKPPAGEPQAEEQQIRTYAVIRDNEEGGVLAIGNQGIDYVPVTKSLVIFHWLSRILVILAFVSLLMLVILFLIQLISTRFYLPQFQAIIGVVFFLVILFAITLSPERLCLKKSIRHQEQIIMRRGLQAVKPVHNRKQMPWENISSISIDKENIEVKLFTMQEFVKLRASGKCGIQRFADDVAAAEAVRAEVLRRAPIRLKFV